MFLPVWEATRGNDGYVSFELDPLLERSHGEFAACRTCVAVFGIGEKGGLAGHKNRMIKVPRDPRGDRSVEAFAAAGVTLNVTLIFHTSTISSRTGFRLARGAKTGKFEQLQKCVQHFRLAG